MKPGHRIFTLRKLLAAAMVLFVVSSLTKLEAWPCLGTNAVGVFTNLANIFLAKSGCNFTVTNIPVFDGTNFVYSPAVNRLLQVAANIYDATTNRAFSDGTSPNGPFYPSVFRPTFGRNGNVVFINGFVEEGDGTTSYQSAPLSLPQDLALVSTNTTNIYGVPWIVGARKGFPNFNQFSVWNFLQVSRVLQIVRPASGPWQTNIMYIVGISNLVAAQAWNSYSSNYPRAIDIITSDNLTVGLTNQDGFSSFTSAYSSSLPPTISSNLWPLGFFPSSAVNTNSFQVPLYFGTTLVSNCVYQQNPPSFLAPGVLAFQNEPGFAFPHFILNTTNQLRFVMLDHATGRVIDYVHFDRAAVSEDLAVELEELNAAPSGVWETNAISQSNPLPVGIYTQYAVSVGALQIPPSEWATPPPSGASIQAAIAAFQEFLLSPNPGVRQFPYTPSVEMIHHSSWQANDPLVHYTVEDLTDIATTTANVPILGSISGSNSFVLASIAELNARYSPWGTVRTSPFYTAKDIALQDPLITHSDAWNFPSGQTLDFNWLGGVHRGTPWQTLYLKSSAIDLTTWQYWTGNANPIDATLAMPANDWPLIAALSTLVNTNSPAQRISINQTDPSIWSGAFQGMTVLTNDPSGLIPLTIDTNANSDALAGIVASINATRSLFPGGTFTNIGQLLAAQALSAGSPFINGSSYTSELNDAAYESIPSQLLPLVRVDSIGSPVASNNPPQFQFSGIEGAAYQVEASTNLQDWQAIGTFYPTNDAFQFMDPSAVSNSARFYRSVLSP